MNEELVSTIHKLLNNKDEIKTMGNSSIILQHKDSKMRIEEHELKNLSTNKLEIERILTQFNTRRDNEYVIVAYDEGNIVGSKITIK